MAAVANPLDDGNGIATMSGAIMPSDSSGLAGCVDVEPMDAPVATACAEACVADTTVA